MHLAFGKNLKPRFRKSTGQKFTVLILLYRVSRRVRALHPAYILQLFREEKMVYDPWYELSTETFATIVACFPAETTKWTVTLRLLERLYNTEEKYDDFVQGSTDSLARYPIFHRVEARIKEITLSNVTNFEVVDLYRQHRDSQPAGLCFVRGSRDDVDDEEKEIERRKNHPLFSFVSCYADLDQNPRWGGCGTVQFERFAYLIVTGGEFAEVENKNPLILSIAQRIHLLKTCSVQRISVFYPSLQDGIKPGGEYKPDVLSPILLNHFAFSVASKTV